MAFPDSFFAEIADTFNKFNKGIASAFNSFDPINGKEIVHLNREACEAKQYGQRRICLRGETLYSDITPSAVRDGLWLYQYGFENNNNLDGSYYRMIMLDELMPARHVFVARSICKKWLGHLPACWTEVEDLRYEVFFNGSYQGEKDKVLLINKIIGDGSLHERQEGRYIPVNLHEIEIECQRGFLDIVFEDMNVFDVARRKAKSEILSQDIERIDNAAP